MNSLRIKDCLLQPTARVLEDARPGDAYEQAIFAVFSESTKDGFFAAWQRWPR